MTIGEHPRISASSRGTGYGGSVELFKGAVALGGLAIDCSAACSVIDPGGCGNKVEAIGSYVWNHPGDFAGSLVDYKDFNHGNYARWAGHLAPTVVITLATCAGRNHQNRTEAILLARGGAHYARRSPWFVGGCQLGCLQQTGDILTRGSAMNRSLWPQKREDGSVVVALRLRAAPSLAAEIESQLANWKSWISTERRVDLGQSLIRDPYILERPGDVVDVVFEGRGGSRLWRDWLVSFTGELNRAHPELQRMGFWDLVGGSPNPASLPPDTSAG